MTKGSRQGPREIKRLPALIYRIDKKLRQRKMTEVERAWDQYMIPGTDILRNELGTERGSYGTTDRNRLTRTEEGLSLSRLDDMLRDPVPGRFDLAHMKEIHRRLFAGVYPWAGQIRNVDLVKQGNSYGSHLNIERDWERGAALFEQKDFFRGITDKDEFVSSLSHSWGRLNYVHAFREGNTRSQTAFFEQLCQQAGWELDIDRLSPHHPESLRDDFIAGRFEYQADINSGRKPSGNGLVAVFNQLVSPSPQKEREIESERRARYPELFRNTEAETGTEQSRVATRHTDEDLTL